jgi:hypothetical protein
MDKQIRQAINEGIKSYSTKTPPRVSSLLLQQKQISI